MVFAGQAMPFGFHSFVDIACQDCQLVVLVSRTCMKTQLYTLKLQKDGGASGGSACGGNVQSFIAAKLQKMHQFMDFSTQVLRSKKIFFNQAFFSI